MKKEYKSHIILLVILLIFLWLLTGCKPKMVYVPFESVKTEYKDKFRRDSIYLKDSVIINRAGDTIYIEKYKYLYRDKFVRDTICKTDSIQVPFPVEVEKEVNRLTSFQSFQVWCGRILLLIIIVYCAYIFVRKKIPF